MHIVHLSPYFFPSVGGLASVFDYLTDYELSQGHQISVLAQKPVAKDDHLEEKAGVAVYRFCPRIHEKVTRSQERQLRQQSTQTLVQIQEESPIDSIHVAGITSMSLAAIRFANQHHIPVVMSLYGEEFSLFKAESIKQWLRHAYFRFKTLKLLKQVSAFTASGRSLQHDLLSLWPEAPCRLIFNGVNFENFYPLSSERRKELRQQFQASDEEMLTVTVSSYHGRKGGLNYGQVFCKLAAKGARCRHILIGEGGELDDIVTLCEQAGIADRLILRGRQPHHELLNHYGASDVYLQLPRWEHGVSMTMLEGQLAGLPVVVTDSEAARDSMEPGVGGFKHSLDEEDKFVEALYQLWSDPQLRRTMGQQGRQWVLDRRDLYNTKEISQSYLKVFKEMCP